MDSTTKATIEKIQSQIGVMEGQIDKKKEAINILCELEGEQIMYPNIGSDRTAASTTFRADQFLGKPTATAVKEILEQRGQNLGAMSLDELFSVMNAGGFVFENTNDQIAKRNLAITMSKNPAFTRVPSNGFWGLSVWYGNWKRRKDANGKGAESNDNGKTEKPESKESSASTTGKEAR